MKSTMVFAAVAMALSAGQAFAEGNGDPFAFQAEVQVTSGRPFVTETMVEQYPQPTGETTQPSSLTQLEPALGHEAPVQTAASLPRGFGDGSVTNAQAQTMARYWAAQQKAGFLEAGGPRPRS